VAFSDHKVAQSGTRSKLFAKPLAIAFHGIRSYYCTYSYNWCRWSDSAQKHPNSETKLPIFKGYSSLIRGNPAIPILTRLVSVLVSVAWNVPRCLIWELRVGHDRLFEFQCWHTNLRILDVQTLCRMPYVPVSHPFAERLCGTIRREYLDHCLFWNALDLEQKLATFRNITAKPGFTRVWRVARPVKWQGTRRCDRAAYTTTSGNPLATGFSSCPSPRK
jgi:hypothetical protein